MTVEDNIRGGEDAVEEDEDDAGAAQDQARGPLRTLSCRTEESTRDALRVVRAQYDG